MPQARPGELILPQATRSCTADAGPGRERLRRNPTQSVAEVDCTNREEEEGAARR